MPESIIFQVDEANIATFNRDGAIMLKCDPDWLPALAEQGLAIGDYTACDMCPVIRPVIRVKP